EPAVDALAEVADAVSRDVDPWARELLEAWPQRAAQAAAAEPGVPLAGTRGPRIAPPRLHDDRDLLTRLRGQNLHGWFPFTAGVFARRRTDEHPARMSAGEGDPARTNRRFHLLVGGQPATRLSTAFDSVTLYGHDPAER